MQSGTPFHQLLVVLSMRPDRGRSRATGETEQAPTVPLRRRDGFDRALVGSEGEDARVTPATNGQAGEAEFVEVRTKYGSLRGTHERGVELMSGCARRLICSCGLSIARPAVKPV
jgi:hypothetical protein